MYLKIAFKSNVYNDSFRSSDNVPSGFESQVLYVNVIRFVSRFLPWNVLCFNRAGWICIIERFVARTVYGSKPTSHYIVAYIFVVIPVTVLCFYNPGIISVHITFRFKVTDVSSKCLFALFFKDTSRIYWTYSAVLI